MDTFPSYEENPMDGSKAQVPPTPARTPTHQPSTNQKSFPIPAPRSTAPRQMSSHQFWAAEPELGHFFRCSIFVHLYPTHTKTIDSRTVITCKLCTSLLFLNLYPQIASNMYIVFIREKLFMSYFRSWVLTTNAEKIYATNYIVLQYHHQTHIHHAIPCRPKFPNINV